MYINHIGIYDDAAAIQAALDAGTLGNPYVALNASAGTLDYNTQSPTPPVPPVESRLKITYNFESTDETPVLTNFTDLFNHAPGKAEFPDGTEFNYDPNEQYGDTTINYTPAETGIASVYFTFSGDTIGNGESGGSLLEMAPAIAIEIPDKVNTIGSAAFYGAAYSAVTFPNHSLTIGNSCFMGLGEGDLLASVSIPAGSSLCGGTFFMQSALENVTIGSGVSFTVGDGMGEFGEIGALTSVTFMDTTPPTVDASTFPWSNEGLQIHVPTGSEQDYVTSFGTDTELVFQVAGAGVIEVDQSEPE